jgi:hypothetical protein
LELVKTFKDRDTQNEKQVLIMKREWDLQRNKFEIIEQQMKRILVKQGETDRINNIILKVVNTMIMLSFNYYRSKEATSCWSRWSRS